MRTIIAVSGGLDSTYALWKLLETGDQITAVHLTGDELSARDLMRYDVRLLNSNQTKRDALSKIFSWLKANVRDFDVANVSVDGSLLRLGIEYPNSTQTIITEWAIKKINDNLADRLVISTEHENDGARNGGTISRRATGAEAARDRFVEFATRGRLDFLLMDMNYHQGMSTRELPAELFALTRSCDIPNPEPCGVCFKCSKRKFFAEAIADGKSDDEIRTYIASKSELPDSRWMTMKNWLKNDVSTYVGGGDKTWDMPVWPSSVDKS
jgi:hypothetical protein